MVLVPIVVVPFSSRALSRARSRFWSATALSTPTRLRRLPASTPAIPRSARPCPGELAEQHVARRQARQLLEHRASIAPPPSRPPRTATTLEYGRRASCSAFAKAPSRRRRSTASGGRAGQRRLELRAARLGGGDLQQASSWRRAAPRRWRAASAAPTASRNLQAPVIGHGHAPSWSGAAPSARRRPGVSHRSASCCPPYLHDIKTGPSRTPSARGPSRRVVHCPRRAAGSRWAGDWPGARTRDATLSRRLLFGLSPSESWAATS